MVFFDLAYNLRIPVHEVMSLPHDEFLKWLDYFEKRPLGWQEDNRFMKILQAIGIKAKPEEVFVSLAKLKEANKRDSGPLPGFAGSALFHSLLSSVGGDTPDFLKEIL